MQNSRRVFLFAGIGMCVRAQSSTLTAREVIERIQKNVGVPWRTPTVDTFKAGDPETPVKGIATSFGGTFEVLRKAAAANRNLVIVHEPTFYNHEDNTKDLSGDVFEAKQAFIEKNKLVIWRFHDHWHARRPDGILTGTAEALDWTKYQSQENPRTFVLPAASLENVARAIKQRLHIRAMRVIGDPKLQVSRVALSPGYNNMAGVIRTLQRPDIDALVIGEAREWEGVEFARDAVTAGKKKALLLLGHVPSEEPGMKECARWLKTFIPEVPVEFIPSTEPFWTPA